ncbi:MAG: DnaK suppressor protein [Alteromonadaceae bacterium]|jgi:DnaK suppressor protein
MTIQNISAVLLNKKSQLERRINAIEIDVKKGRSSDFAEQTTECENDEVLDEIHHEAVTELTLITEALQRIDDNKYGLCVNCEEQIDPQRLSILPYISTCIRCAQ